MARDMFRIPVLADGVVVPYPATASSGAREAKRRFNGQSIRPNVRLLTFWARLIWRVSKKGEGRGHVQKLDCWRRCPDERCRGCVNGRPTKRKGATRPPVGPRGAPSLSHSGHDILDLTHPLFFAAGPF